MLPRFSVFVPSPLGLMRASPRRLAWVALVLALILGRCGGYAAETAPEPTLRIAVMERPPFATRVGEQWSGLVPDIWSAVGRRSHLRVEYVPVKPESVAAQLAAGAIDVGPPTTISAGGIRATAFTPPILATGLATLTMEERDWNWRAELSRLGHSGVFRVLVGIVFANLLVGFSLWAIERRRNPANFGGKPAEGVASGIWCSVATMMTVGYGDRVPITWLGRVLCFMMMLSGLIITSLFTAAATSSLTVAHLQPRVHSASDLKHVVSAAIAGSPGEEYLRRHAFPVLVVPDMAAARQALAHGDAVAFVHDRIELRAAFDHQPGRFIILPLNLQEEFFAFPLTANRETQRRVNIALQEFIDSDEWDRIDAAYLGE
jgi:polar amino acid transport system substrate-binding protein